MKITLTELKATDLRTFSYIDTIDVIDELEYISMSRYSGIDAVEVSETCLSFALLIVNRIRNNEFPELTPKNKKNEKMILESRLVIMISGFKYALDINKLNKRIKEVESEKNSLNQKIDDVEKKIADTVSDYTNKKITIVKEVNLFKKRINNAEHDILSHVLSLMGIFSAVITLIISVVVTSSSWLNNADGASAPIAFIVPNLVTLIAVLVLMTLVYYFVHHDDTTERKKKRIKTIYILIGVVIVLCLVVAIVFVTLQHATPPTHARYIISPNQYEIVEEAEEASDNCQHNTDCNCHTKIEIKKYFEITFEGKKYRFEHKEKLKHDGNLYFCAKHEILE